MWENNKYHCRLRNDWFKTNISVIHIGFGHETRLHAKALFLDFLTMSLVWWKLSCKDTSAARQVTVGGHRTISERDTLCQYSSGQTLAAQVSFLRHKPPLLRSGTARMPWRQGMERVFDLCWICWACSQVSFLLALQPLYTMLKVSSPAELSQAQVARASSHTQSTTLGQVKELLFSWKQTRRGIWAHSFLSQHRTRVKMTSSASSSSENHEMFWWQPHVALQLLAASWVKSPQHCWPRPPP